jgi:hypothetical protein
VQPEDLSGGVPAAEGRVPDSWVGRRVEAVVVRPVNPDQPGYSTSLTALTYEGLLEEVNDRGIVASLSSEVEMLAASPSTRGARSSPCGSPKSNSALLGGGPCFS